MTFEIARAHQLYKEAMPGVALLHRSARLAIGAAALIYSAILDKIEAIDYQVYEKRAHTSRIRKVLMLPGIVWKIGRLNHQR